MKYLDLTFPTPEANLACDEALLDRCDEGDGPEVLRFWEPPQYFIVVGYSNRVGREVAADACQELGIPILRRCSGGGTVVQGPGCLNYSLILRIESAPALQTVTGTNRCVMERNRAALQPLLARDALREEALPSEFENRSSKLEIAICGHTDLAIGGFKFSGNAQRRKRRAVLFHGTILLSFDIGMTERILLPPSKQPAYRQNRSHVDFLTNIGVRPEAVKNALSKQWDAQESLGAIPLDVIERLAEEKYSATGWSLKL